MYFFFLFHFILLIYTSFFNILYNYIIFTRKEGSLYPRSARGKLIELKKFSLGSTENEDVLSFQATNLYLRY